MIPRWSIFHILYSLRFSASLFNWADSLELDAPSLKNRSISLETLDLMQTWYFRRSCKDEAGKFGLCNNRSGVEDEGGKFGLCVDNSEAEDVDGKFGPCYIFSLYHCSSYIWSVHAWQDWYSIIWSKKSGPINGVLWSGRGKTKSSLKNRTAPKNLLLELTQILNT